MIRIKNMLPLLIFIPSVLSALSPEGIIMKLERNLVYNSSKSIGRIIIKDRFGERISSFIIYTEGKDKSMVEFTGKEEAGQKVLRIEDEIYLYYPDADEIIRLKGAALKQSIIGSDMSYEDMAGDRSILDSYRISPSGEENLNGRDCYIINLTAKTKNVPYQKQTIWIDKEEFIYLKIMQFAKSGRLLKVLTVLRTQKINGRTIPVDILIKDALKRNSSTEFLIDSFELDPDIPEETFNLQGLW